MKNLKKVSQVFGEGVKGSLQNETGWGIATVVGIWHGLKYNGNLVRGLKGGLTVLGVFALADGVRNLVNKWDTIPSYKEESIDVDL